jgi:hypothetical protein
MGYSLNSVRIHSFICMLTGLVLGRQDLTSLWQVSHAQLAHLLEHLSSHEGEWEGVNYIINLLAQWRSAWEKFAWRPTATCSILYLMAACSLTEGLQITAKCEMKRGAFGKMGGPGTGSMAPIHLFTPIPPLPGSRYICLRYEYSRQQETQRKIYWFMEVFLCRKG